MKRNWIRLLLCMALTCAALAGAALAADSDYCKDGPDGTVTYTAEAAGKAAHFTASLDGATAGKEYTLLVVDASDDAINFTNPAYTIVAGGTGNTVEYISQQTATGATVSFEFIPMKTTRSYVLVTSNDGAAVRILGALTGYTDGVEVTGTVTLQTRTAFADITVTLTDVANAQNTFTVTTAANGAFEITGVADGTYTITYQKDSFLLCSKQITVDGEALSAGTTQLLAGDVGQDRYINSRDLSAVQVGFGQSGVSGAVDVTGDSYVNSRDLSAVLTNFGKNSTTAYAS